MSEKVQLGWHFLRADRRLQYGDNRLAVDGETLSYTGKDAPICCERGMHASEQVSQALVYAPGAVLCRVEVWGDLSAQHDKFVGRHRKILWSLPEAEVLPMIVEYAKWCADRAKGHAADAAAAAAIYAADAADAATAAAARAARADADADAAYAAYATNAVIYAARAAYAATDAAATAAAYAATGAAAAAAAAAAAGERKAQAQWWIDKLVPILQEKG